MKLPSSRSNDDVGSSMTPMIDVVFLLLVFFLCTASFQQSEQLLPTTLPPTGAVSTAPPQEVQELGVIRLNLSQPDGSLMVMLNGSSYDDLSLLRQQLVRLAGFDLPVVLDISSEVQIGYTVDVYDMCQAVGLTRVNFAAPEEG